MNTTAQLISYGNTGAFSKIVTDYISGNEALQQFYKHPFTLDGIKASIRNRKLFNTNRSLLVTQLQKQYQAVETSQKVKTNIELLGNENTFTVCTAHQPNIFTGHLYFVYKILHAVKLAKELKKELPENNFVPVFFMGSEDADLEELGHVYINGEKHEWKTDQTGAVGRMKVDRALIKLIETVSGQLLIYPFGKEIIELIKTCYTEGETIEQASFKLINILFADYGLIVLLPDNAALKKEFIPVVEKELTVGFSYKAVQQTAAEFPKEYKMQASGRELNLFYLKDDLRQRIVEENSKFKIQNSKFEFSKAEIIEELKHHPERFSPNVILRPVFQEMVLPNIAFIGGGGEIAYWLELKKVFESVNIPFPVLILRNSFLVIEKSYGLRVAGLGFNIADLFKPENELLNELVKRESKLQLNLEKEKKALVDFYQKLKNVSAAVDATLAQHTEALQAKAFNKIEALEKKLLKAEKKKFEAQQRQLHKLKTQLFPHNNLQERIENIMPFYAKHGTDFIKIIYENSLSLEQKFVILEEK